MEAGEIHLLETRGKGGGKGGFMAHLLPCYCIDGQSPPSFWFQRFRSDKLPRDACDPPQNPEPRISRPTLYALRDPIR